MFWVTYESPASHNIKTSTAAMTCQAPCTLPCQLEAASPLHCCVYDPCLISCISSKHLLEQFSIASHLFFFSVQMLFSVFLIFCFGHHHCSFWSVHTQFCGFSCNVEWLQLWVLGCPTSFILCLCNLQNCYLLTVLLLICHGSWGIK